MDLSVSEIQKFFFEGMLQGCASGKGSRPVTSLFGYKEYPPYEARGLRMLDRWCVSSAGNRVAGTITIWHKDVPVWVMQYGGGYDQRAEHFLRMILTVAYEERRFHGGRGLTSHTHGSFSYMNKPRKNTFGDFEGSEYIIHRQHGHLGRYDYRGMLLVSQ